MGDAKRRREEKVRRLAEAVTRGLADEGTVVEAGFTAFVAQFKVPPPPGARAAMRFAFYSAAQHVFSSIMVMMDGSLEPTDRDLARMDGVYREVEAFRLDLEGRMERGEPLFDGAPEGLT